MLMTSHAMAAEVSQNNHVQIGGLIQTDFAGFGGQADAGDRWDNDFNGGGDFRRVELAIKGNIDDSWNYQIAYDIDDTEWDDTWLGYGGFDPLWLAVGRLSIPQGLENWNSSSSLQFMERAATADAFSPPESGIGFYGEGHTGKVSYAAAFVFPDHNEQDNAIDETFANSDPWSAGGRLTVAPINSEESVRQVLHFGGSYYYQTVDENQYFSGLAARPEVAIRNAPALVESVVTGMVAGQEIADTVDYIDVWGLEAAGIWGPFSAQGEYEKYYLYGNNGYSNLEYNGWYVQAGYVLTGESRAYYQDSGTFGNVTPSGKIGAWEVAVRYNHIDLSDTGENWVEPDNDDRGRQSDWTLGLNWYVNNNVKFQFNYVRADADYSTDKPDRTVDVYAVRAQVRF